jgi:hypothetical protein
MNWTQILVIFNCDNGYKCSCCNTSWEESEVYNTDQSIDEFISELKIDTRKTYYDNSKWGRFEILKAYVIDYEVNLDEIV